ncbi:MAG TPA: hypothetical protein VFU05_02870, partial [Cyclobacteriaceae bacterium]|nr:hypothetical protein [Cyclobacteriaceae bacterium]
MKNVVRGIYSQISSIKTSVIPAFSLIVLIMVGASFTTYVQVSKLKESQLRESFRALQKQVMDIKLSSHEFILKDRNNVQFFASGKSEFIDHYQNAFQQYQQSYIDIRTRLSDTGLGETEELDGLHKKVQEYDDIFKEIELGIKTRGIDKYGIIGDFGIALDKMNRFDYGSDNISLLRLKYYIQDYQLNGSSNTIRQIGDETYLFSNQLEKYISDQQVVLVVYALSDYEANFKKLVAIDSTLGLYSGKGLQGRLYAKMNEIDDLLPLT